MSQTVPYENATSGNRAREEVLKILRRFGCEEAGFMDKYDEQKVLLHFKPRGQAVQMHVSARGWAALWMQKHPLSPRARKSRHEYEQEALNQGHLAVSSILRDLVKSQLTAVECGVLSFTEVFLPHMLTNDGRRLIDRVGELLPKADESKVVQIPHKPSTAA